MPLDFFFYFCLCLGSEVRALAVDGFNANKGSTDEDLLYNRFVRQLQIAKPKYKVFREPQNSVSESARKLINHRRFQIFSGACVFLNVCMMLADHADSTEVSHASEILNSHMRGRTKCVCFVALTRFCVAAGVPTNDRSAEPGLLCGALDGGVTQSGGVRSWRILGRSLERIRPVCGDGICCRLPGGFKQLQPWELHSVRTI